MAPSTWLLRCHLPAIEVEVEAETADEALDYAELMIDTPQLWAALDRATFTVRPVEHDA